MWSQGLVSVVVPNYNRESLIGATLASALAQTGVSVEVLVCDDGSTDGSEAVVRSFEDDRVRWLPGPPFGGPAGPRNRGIAAAAGEWVAFLDSDDVWEPDKLSKQLDLLSRVGGSACSTNAYRFIPAEGAVQGTLFDRLPATASLERQLSANLVVTSAMVVSADALARVGGFPEARRLAGIEDYALWLRLAHLEPIRLIEAPLVHYRDDADNSIRGTMGLEWRSCVRALRDFTAWRRSQNPPVRTSVSERLLMARQVAGLVSVRKIAARGARRMRAS